MEKITHETIGKDVREFLEQKKRRPFIVLIKAVIIIALIFGAYFSWKWLIRKEMIADDSTLFYFVGIGGAIFVMIAPMDWKIPVKIRPSEINLLLPTFMKVKQQDLEKEKNTQENLFSRYTELAANAQNEANQAEINLQELQKINNAFKKAQEID